MHPDLDLAICAHYPKIFVNRHAPDILSCMGRGFEIDDGWYVLICRLCDALQRTTDQHGMPQIIAIQVKEKLGTLRFRVESTNEYQRTLIDCAEALSICICEVCGKPGQSGLEYGLSRPARCKSHLIEQR